MRFWRLTILAILVVVLGTMTVWAQEDVEGSHDHPLVTRMPGYYIDNYAVQEFGAFAPTVIGGKEVNWEGKKYSISYYRKENTPQTSMLQITRNYEQALKVAGATILGGDERRLAAELRKGGAMTGIYIEAFNEGNTYSLTIVESQPMRQDVVVDAAAMGKDITASGKVIIYGIYFDTGSAVIKQESERRGSLGAHFSGRRDAHVRRRYCRRFERACRRLRRPPLPGCRPQPISASHGNPSRGGWRIHPHCDAVRRGRRDVQ